MDRGKRSKQPERELSYEELTAEAEVVGAYWGPAIVIDDGEFLDWMYEIEQEALRGIEGPEAQEALEMSIKEREELRREREAEAAEEACEWEEYQRAQEAQRGKAAAPSLAAAQ